MGEKTRKGLEEAMKSKQPTMGYTNPYRDSSRESSNETTSRTPVTRPLY